MKAGLEFANKAMGEVIYHKCLHPSVIDQQPHLPNRALTAANLRSRLVVKL